MLKPFVKFLSLEKLQVICCIANNFWLHAYVNIFIINVNLHDNEIKHKFFINIIIITVLLISLRKVRFLL